MWNWRYGVDNMRDWASEETYVGDTLQPEVSGRIGGAENYQLVGFEGVWNDGPTQIVAELQNAWLCRDMDSDLQFYGGYIQASHFLTGEHMHGTANLGSSAGRCQKPCSPPGLAVAAGRWPRATPWPTSRTRTSGAVAVNP